MASDTQMPSLPNSPSNAGRGWSQPIRSSQRSGKRFLSTRCRDTRTRLLAPTYSMSASWELNSAPTSADLGHSSPRPYANRARENIRLYPTAEADPSNVTIRAARFVPEYLRLTNGPNRLCRGFRDSSRHPPAQTYCPARWRSRCCHRPDAITVQNQTKSQRQANGRASAGTEWYATGPRTTSADRRPAAVPSASTPIRELAATPDFDLRLHRLRKPAATVPKDPGARSPRLQTMQSLASRRLPCAVPSAKLHKAQPLRTLYLASHPIPASFASQLLGLAKTLLAGSPTDAPAATQHQSGAFPYPPELSSCRCPECQRSPPRYDARDREEPIRSRPYTDNSSGSSCDLRLRQTRRVDLNCGEVRSSAHILTTHSLRPRPP